MCGIQNYFQDKYILQAISHCYALFSSLASNHSSSTAIQGNRLFFFECILQSVFLLSINTDVNAESRLSIHSKSEPHDPNGAANLSKNATKWPKNDPKWPKVTQNDSK